MTAQVGDFLDTLATHLEGLPLDPILSKGVNLFREILFEESEDDPSAAIDSFSLYDLGYPEPRPTFGYSQLEWSVRLVSNRPTRSSSIESIRPMINELLEARAFGDDLFSVKNVRVDTSPEFSARLQNGRFQAQSILIFSVVPKEAP